MKVLQIRSEFRDNGPGSQALTLARELRSRDHEVIFAASGGELVDEIRNSGFDFSRIETLAVDRRGLGDVLSTLKQLRKLIKKHKPDVIHGHNAASIVLAAIAARTAGIRAKYVQSVRGVELRRGYQWRNLIYRINPARLLAVSEFTKRELVSLGAKADNIHVTFNGVDLQRFDPDVVKGDQVRNEFNLGEGPVIGHVGNFSGWKGQELLVRSAAELRQRFPNLRFVLVGKGPALNAAQKLARELGVEDTVVFPGFRRDIPEFQACFDIYCQPSTQGEMFPNAIIEAMAMRNCWIGSNLSGLGELSAAGDAGDLVAPGDQDGLTRAICSLLERPDAIESRGIAARQFVEDNLTIAKVVDRVEAVYRLQ